MCLVITAMKEMHIVCRDRFQAEITGKFDQLGQHLELRPEAVVVDLDIDIFLTENIDQLLQRLGSLDRFVRQQPLIDGTGNASCETNDALGELAQITAIDARFAIIHPLEMTDCHQFG